MSLDLQTRMRTFYASAPQRIWTIETLQLSHSAMSQTFCLWREPYPGVTYADGSIFSMTPCNMKIKRAGIAGHLDQVFNVALDLTDSNDLFRDQLDLIPIETKEFVRAVYREYLSDDLANPQASAVLQAESTGWNQGVANISLASPRLNITRTGERYTPRDIPMLRGFL